MTRITKLFEETQTARTNYVFDYQDRREHIRLIGDDECEKANADALRELYEIKAAIENKGISDYVAKLMKDIAEALSKNSQRFFHHDRRKSDGLWVEGQKMLFANTDIVLCDEAQRLGNYSNFDEASALASHPSQVFFAETITRS